MIRVCRNGHQTDTDVAPCTECERNRRRREQHPELPGPHPPKWMGTLPWMEQAACRGFDPELWFPDGNGWEAVAQARKARAICFTCPVQTECFDLGMARDERYGIWGGFGAKFRHDLNSRRAASGS